MKIIGPASADQATVEDRLLDHAYHPRFITDMAPALWEAADLYGLDPVGVIAQAWKETGGGHFLGQVLPEFYNTCGLKVRHVGKYPGLDDGDRPLAHAQFANWRVGATAHVQHLLAYTGTPIDFCVLIVDPRYTLVSGPPVTDYEDLGGRWAPSLTYGEEVAAIARLLAGLPA